MNNSQDKGFSLNSALQNDEADSAFAELYVPLKIAERATSIRDEITAVVESIAKQYCQDVDIEQAHSLLKLMIKLESNSIIALYKQVVYTEHIIDTLMTRLDNAHGGGGSEYMMLIQLQPHLVSLIHSLLASVRNMPLHIRTAVTTTINTYNLEIEEHSSTEQQLDDGVIRASNGQDLLDQVDAMIRKVRQDNSEIDDMTNEDMPKQFKIDDDLLVGNDSLDDAKQLHDKRYSDNEEE